MSAKGLSLVANNANWSGTSGYAGKQRSSILSDRRSDVGTRKEMFHTEEPEDDGLKMPRLLSSSQVVFVLPQLA